MATPETQKRSYLSPLPSGASEAGAKRRFTPEAAGRDVGITGATGGGRPWMVAGGAAVDCSLTLASLTRSLAQVLSSETAAEWRDLDPEGGHAAGRGGETPACPPGNEPTLISFGVHV